MFFLATGSLSHPDQIGPYADEEARVLAELRAQGTMREAFRRATGGGVIGIVAAPSLDEAKHQLGRLPYVAHGLLVFDSTELIEL
jgi:muconolactone delta-isomerase